MKTFEFAVYVRVNADNEQDAHGVVDQAFEEWFGDGPEDANDPVIEEWNVLDGTLYQNEYEQYGLWPKEQQA